MHMSLSIKIYKNTHQTSIHVQYKHRNTEHDAHSHVHTLTSSILLVLEGCTAGLRPTGLGPVYSRLKSFVGEMASLTPDILGLGGYWVPGH